jgi:hypothetical protein
VTLCTEVGLVLSETFTVLDCNTAGGSTCWDNWGKAILTDMMMIHSEMKVASHDEGVTGNVGSVRLLTGIEMDQTSPRLDRPRPCLQFDRGNSLRPSVSMRMKCTIG